MNRLKKVSKLIFILIIMLTIQILIDSKMNIVNAAETDTDAETEIKSSDLEPVKVHFETALGNAYKFSDNNGGDTILLETKDSEGNTIYGLIDGNRGLNTMKTTMEGVNDENGNPIEMTYAKKFLLEHGVEKLEFVVATHMHSDHAGALDEVIRDFEIDRFYIKEFDRNNFVKEGEDEKNFQRESSLKSMQKLYETVLTALLDKTEEQNGGHKIQVIGIRPEALTNRELSPGLSDEIYAKIMQSTLDNFEPFYENSETDTNAAFKFGDANIKFVNWKIYSKDGKICKGNGDNREKISNENCNSLCEFLTLGTGENQTKAFFAADLANWRYGEKAPGYEELAAQEIGDIDFLKVAHHGITGSTEQVFLDVVKPEYGFITRSMGAARQDVKDRLDAMNVDYRYLTHDPKCVTVEIKQKKMQMTYQQFHLIMKQKIE